MGIINIVQCMCNGAFVDFSSTQLNEISLATIFIVFNSSNIAQSFTSDSERKMIIVSDGSTCFGLSIFNLVCLATIFAWLIQSTGIVCRWFVTRERMGSHVGGQ
jgi:hypothetical protein